ncbi:MAG: iron chelate uptake ABC transporter family permease subunit [Planctomycetota bacterium]
MTTERSPSWRRGLVWASAALLFVSAARLGVGTSGFGLSADQVGRTFLWLRAERLAVAAVAGLALAVSGVSLQALLRNPLAEPYLLGLSTGAAVGMVAAATLGAERVGVSSGIGAVLGAGLTMAAVFALGRRRGVLDPLGVLLVGVVVSTINGAIVLLLAYLNGPGGVRDEVARWMMGSLSVSGGWSTSGVVATATALGWGWMLFRGPALDVATLSDEEASGLGVDVARLRTEAFVAAAALAGGAVVLAGPVAFVGLIAPHLARALCGAPHRGVLIVAGVLGAALLVAADVAGVLVKLASEGVGRPTGLIPVGVWTALVGGVSFVVLLRPRLGRGE